jgi:hypothetical protein
MRNVDVFLAWAPEGSIWSAWAKPVLFASMPEGGRLSLPSWLADAKPPSGSIAIPPYRRDTVLVIDLPGERAVHAGLMAAGQGWRPVPLFNGCHSGELTRMIVDTHALIRALADGVPILDGTFLSPEAPPAFLLDQRRLSGAGRIGPGDYDNRWCVVPQDMPSARRLKQGGLRRVVLVGNTVMEDLAHILRRYEEGGLELFQIRYDQAQEERLSVPRPRWFRSLWHRIQVLAGLRRNAAGGFGALIPIPSESSGYG